MNNWDTRIANGTRFEEVVADQLRERGWSVSPFGRATLSAEVNALFTKDDPTPVRWLPDIYACRRTDGKLQEVFIDAKTGRTDTTNHDGEVAAIKAGSRWSSASGIPVYLVFRDGLVLHPFRVCQMKLPERQGVAPGRTTWWLWPKTGQPFDSVFGPAIP